MGTRKILVIFIIFLLISLVCPFHFDLNTVLADDPPIDDPIPAPVYGNFIHPSGYNPQEYYNDSGTWRPINLTIKPYNDGTYDYIVNQTWYTYYMRNHSSWGDGFKFVSEGYSFIYQPSDYSFRNQYGSQDYISSIADKTAIINNNNHTATYSNVFPNVTLQYKMQPTMVKEYYVIDKLPRAPAEYLGTNVTVDFGGYIKYGTARLYVDGVDKTGTDFVTNHEIEFRDSSHNLLYYLPEPYATDTIGNSTSCYYEVKTQGQQIWFYVRTPYSFFQNATFPVKVDPPVYGVITAAVISSYEWDPEEGQNYGLNGACRVNSTDYWLTVACGDTGSTCDGWARTIKVWGNNATIKPSVISSYEYDTTDGCSANVRHIPGTDKYVVAYQDKLKVTVVTLKVSASTGAITASNIDTQSLTYLSFSTGGNMFLLQVTSNVWAVAYGESSTSDGFIETLWIASTGIINNTLLDIQEFDGTFGLQPYLCMVDSNTIAITYNSGSTAGEFTLMTYNISSSGLITNTPADSWAYEVNPFDFSCINKVGSNVFAVTWMDMDYDIQSNTVTIADTGAITKSWIDTLEIYNDVAANWFLETFVVHDPQTTADGSGILGLTFQDAAGDGRMLTWNVTKAGVMPATPIGVGFEFDTADSFYFAHVEYVNQSWYLIIYTGTGYDGWSATVKILTNWQAPAFSTPQPTNGTTGVYVSPRCNITVNDINADTMTISWFTNMTGSWVCHQTNTSVTNGTYKWDFTEAITGLTKYWWKVYANDSIHNVSAVYCFTTATAPPTFSNPVPTNGSTGIAFTPKCNITITDADGDSMKLDWFENSTGGWVHRQSNSSCPNGTYRWTFIQASSYITKYWWKVYANDATYNVSAVYCFTTFEHIPTIVLNNPSPNGTTEISFMPICAVWANDTGSEKLNITWWENSTGPYVMRQKNSTVDPNAIYRWNYSQATSYKTTYYWKVYVDDQTTNVSKWYYFITIRFEDYILAGGATNYTVKQYWTSDMLYKARTASYGGIIYALPQDDTYVYAGGAMGTVCQYWKSNMTYKAATANYGGVIYALAQDDTYVYAGGATTLTVRQYWKSNMTYKAATASYGGTIRALAQDDTYVYAGGATTLTVRQYWKSNMTYKAATASYGGVIYALAQDDTYVYAGGATTLTVCQYWKSNMTYKTQTPTYGGTIWALAQNDTYIYVGGALTQRVCQYWKSNMTYKARTLLYGGTIDALAQDDTYVYAGGATTLTVRQYWKSNMTYKAATASYGGTIYALSFLKIVHIPTIVLSNPSPNGTTEISLTPICAVWANDTGSEKLNITWWENSTGPYVMRQKNSTVDPNAIYRWNYSQATSYNTKYYWKVYVDDQTTNVSSWYCFTTEAGGITIIFDVNRTSFGFGIVQNNTIIYSNTTQADTFRIYNNGTCNIDIDINGTDATASGVSAWILSPTNGDNMYKMEIYNSTTNWFQVNLTEDTWYSNMVQSTNITANLRITTPIVFYSGKQMSCHIYMWASIA